MLCFSRPFFQALARVISNTFPASLFLFSATVLTQTATAAILHGDFSDIPPGAIMYLDVEESSFSEPVPPPLYGRPTIAANLLDFDPSEFGASSLDGAAKRSDGQLTFKIGTIPGAGLAGFSIVESGDFQFAGMQADSSTHVSASTDVTVSILAVDGLILPSPIPVAATRVFASAYADAFPTTTPLSLVAYHVCGFGVGHLVSLHQRSYEARSGH